MHIHKNILYTAFAIGVIGYTYMVTMFGKSAPNTIAFKVFPALTLSLLTFFHSKNTKANRNGITAGLVFSALGDFFLDMAVPNSFIYGLCAFLVAHLLYFYAFGKDIVVKKPKKKYLPLYVLYVEGVVAFVYFYGAIDAALQIYVFLYAMIIGLMFWASSGCGKYAWWGALIFTVSDGLICINKFYMTIPYAQYIILYTYWMAQMLIAFSCTKIAVKSKLK